MNSNLDIGEFGEDLAYEYLESKGFEILERNWRYGHWEIDLIAKEGQTTVFVEVKTRKSTTYGMPEEGLTKKKLKSIIAAGTEYLQKNPNWDIRYDCISILLQGKKVKDLLHIKDIYV
jgi:putative endonuclease